MSIDGPAGSGKSTVARRLAERLGLHYLDTGAMYRAVAVAGMRAGADLDDDAAMSEVAATSRIEFEHDTGSMLPTRVLLDGDDVTREIRTPQADEAVSRVARLPGVRKVMVARQREMAARSDLVVEGRDIGTVVFPDADVKVYLTAAPEERAGRRHAELVERGEDIALDEVLAQMQSRDHADATRKDSPLTVAEDAHELDTTGLTIDEVVEAIATLVEEGA